MEKIGYASLERIILDLTIAGAGLALWGLVEIYLLLKERRLKEFVAKGRLTLGGVDFYLFAKNKEDARRRFAAGEYAAFDTDRAATEDAEIKTTSIEENQ